MNCEKMPWKMRKVRGGKLLALTLLTSYRFVSLPIYMSITRTAEKPLKKSSWNVLISGYHVLKNLPAIRLYVEKIV